MKKILSSINNLMRNLFKIEFRAFPYGDLKRRMAILNHYKINKIFDVGANRGQYIIKMRKLGFKGEAISFEPLSEAFDILKANSAKDENWQIMKLALGDTNEESYINIAGNLDSSSILEMLPSHIEIAPKTKYTGKEKITIIKFDDIINDFYANDDNILIKIDTQGFEKNVIEGAKKTLDKIALLQLEMSLTPLYEGETLYLEMIKYLEELGFRLFSIENGFWDHKKGQLLQIDGIFINKTLLNK